MQSNCCASCEAAKTSSTATTTVTSETTCADKEDRNPDKDCGTALERCKEGDEFYNWMMQWCEKTCCEWAKAQ
jgi:hypothetical protein